MDTNSATMPGSGLRYRIAEVYMFDTCTHRCGYCWLAESGQVLDAAQLKPFRDPAFIARVAEFFNSRTDPSPWLLQFTGGEPLLAPNLRMLCKSLFAAGNSVAFYTALLLPEGHGGFQFLLEHSAPQVDYVMASFHPEAEADEDTYFRKIARLKKQGHRVIVRYVGHPARLSRLDDVDARCRDLDVCFYPTTLLSQSYPQRYDARERATLTQRFTSLSQHIQLGGGVRTDSATCYAGSRLIAVNLQTGNITPCITVDGPSLGNVLSDTFTPSDSVIRCPLASAACLCDVHFQQDIVQGAEDSAAFEAQKRGYVWSGRATAPARLAAIPMFEGPAGIGDVQDISRLFFTKDEVKNRWKSRSDRRTGSLGRWSVTSALDALGSLTIRVQLADALPMKYVEVFVNDAPDATTAGPWLPLYAGPHNGRALDLQVPAGDRLREPGTHRIALNVHFEDGTICYWYNQPPSILVVPARVQAADCSNAVSSNP